MKQKILCFLFFGLSFLMYSQTNPTPVDIPYSQDFSGTAYASTTFPSGFIGWQLGTSAPPGATWRTSEPIANVNLNNNSTAAQVGANAIQNYNGKLGFLHSGSGEVTLAMAINTTGHQNVKVNYNVMTIRNPYDGSGNTRIIENILQYRIGTTGTFTNLTAVAYQNNTTLQTGTVTTPQKLEARSVVLPSACDNQSVVQLRWVSRDVSGAGSRPSVAIDDINIAPGPKIITSGSLTALTTTYGSESTNTSFDVSGSNLTSNISINAPSGFEISTSSTSNFSNSITLTQSSGSVANTTIYVRLAATTLFGTYNGNINLSSDTASVLVPTVTSSVNKKELTITGISIEDKIFDGNSNAVILGSATLNGIVNNDDISLGGLPVATFNDAAIGDNKPVTISGYSISGTNATSYTLVSPSLFGNIISNGLSDQTITFNSLSPVTYGDNSFALSASSDSNLDISYSSSNLNVATISGNIVTIIGAGSTTIIASQNGDSSYNPAISVAQDLVVNTKEITLVGANVSNKTYDGNSTASLSGTITGVVTGDDVTVNLIANFQDFLVGTNKQVTSTSTLSGAASSNYYLTQPTGLLASILPIPNTIVWNFGLAGGTTTPLVSLQNITVSPLTPNNNNGTTTVYLASGINSTGYVGATGTINASMACFAGALNTSTSSYHEFTITPGSGYAFSLNEISFGSRSSSTGPQLYSIRTSLDGYSTNVSSGALQNNATWTKYLTSINGVSNIDIPVTFRIYGSNGTGSPAANTSNWRMDDIIITGSVMSTDLPLNITSSLTTSATVDNSFTYQITTDGTPSSYAASGLPVGLSINTTTGVISGTPTQAGIFNVEISATNSIGTTTETLEIMVIPTTSIIASQCNSIIEFHDRVYSARVNGASGYRFNIYNADGTGEPIALIENHYNFFRFTQMNFESGVTYLVKVQVKQGSVYGAEGSGCFLTLTTPTTTLIPSQCGGIINYVDRVYPTGVDGATGYAFDIYASDGITLITTIENNYSFFRFTQINFTLGATYQVRVRVKRGNVYGSAGTPCSVTIANTLPITNLETTQCGGTINYLDRVYPIGVSGATGYAFDIYAADGTTLITTIENSYNFFRFTQINFTLGATYQVKVRVKRGSVYGLAGIACSITIRNELPTTKLETAQCGETINYNDRVYPIGVTGATGYAFDIYASDGTTFLATIENSYNFFKFSQLENYVLGNNYYVQVRVKRNTVYGDPGTACMVQLNNPNARELVDVKNEESSGIVANGNLQLYPNPFTSTFQITPIAEETATLFYQVYDITGKMIESQSVEANEVQYHTIGEMYPVGMYLVIVRQGATTQTFKMVKQ